MNSDSMLRFKRVNDREKKNYEMHFEYLCKFVCLIIHFNNKSTDFYD